MLGNEEMIKAIRERAKSLEFGLRAIVLELCRRYERQLAVDAVPVVWCKECKYYQPGRHFTDINFCYRLPLYAEKGGLDVSDDDFCSHGEYGYGEGREVET